MHVGEEQAEVDELSADETSRENVAGYRRIEDPHSEGDVAHAHHEPKANASGDESEDAEMG